MCKKKMEEEEEEEEMQIYELYNEKKKAKKCVSICIYTYLEESSILAGVIVDHNSEEGQNFTGKNLSEDIEEQTTQNSTQGLSLRRERCVDRETLRYQDMILVYREGDIYI